MQIKNFIELKNVIDDGVLSKHDRKNHPDLPEDFFNFDGRVQWGKFMGEVWKEGEKLYVNFESCDNNDKFFTIKINNIKYSNPIDYKEEKTKQKIYDQAKEKNFSLVENYLDFKDNIFEYTLNNSNPDNKILFADQTIFLVDKYEMFLQVVYETKEIYTDRDVMELSGQLYIYAQNIQVVDTNIEGLE